MDVSANSLMNTGQTTHDPPTAIPEIFGEKKRTNDENDEQSSIDMLVGTRAHKRIQTLTD